MNNICNTDSGVISQSNLNKLRALWKIDLNVKYAPLLNIVKNKSLAIQLHDKPKPQWSKMLAYLTIYLSNIGIDLPRQYMWIQPN